MPDPDVSERSYACLAQNAPDPAAFDRGLAPFQMLVNLRAAHDGLGRHDSLEGLTIGVPCRFRASARGRSRIRPSSLSTTFPTIWRSGPTAQAG
jgi:hypothetical protein